MSEMSISGLRKWKISSKETICGFREFSYQTQICTFNTEYLRDVELD